MLTLRVTIEPMAPIELMEQIKSIVPIEPYLKVHSILGDAVT